MALRVRPTKGALLQLKRRLAFIEEGYELLKMKRDELAKEIRVAISQLEEVRRPIEAKAEEAYQALRNAYVFLGGEEVRSQAASIERELEVEILPSSVMGVLVPRLKRVGKPEVRGKVGPIVRVAAQRLHALIDDLVRLAEVEGKIERLADDLEKTNRKVNSLEKVIIPDLKRAVRLIEGWLEEDLLEEFARTKIVRNLLVARRA